MCVLVCAMTETRSFPTPRRHMLDDEEDPESKMDESISGNQSNWTTNYSGSSFGQQTPGNDPNGNDKDNDGDDGKEEKKQSDNHDSSINAMDAAVKPDVTAFPRTRNFLVIIF